ncbi:hypothetical protein, partial [Citrobacter freundii]
PGILAVDALNLMQSRHITSVMVADGELMSCSQIGKNGK